ADGATLMAHWSWAADLLSEQEAHDLAQGWFAVLEALVRHAEQPGAGGRSPCDLPLLRLSQDEIERIESKYPHIEDILPLSPLQEGLLFHALYDVGAPDIYIVQLALALEGPLDGARLERAAQVLVERHASLRAGFEHEKLSRPVQVMLAGWREALAGLQEPTRVAAYTPADPPAGPQQITVTLSEALTTALSEQGRREGLTLNTFIQTAWAILLGRQLSRDDVVFGVTVA